MIDFDNLERLAMQLPVTWFDPSFLERRRDCTTDEAAFIAAASPGTVQLLVNELRRLRTFVADLRDAGVRHDLNPSMIVHSGNQFVEASMFYTNYLKSIDDLIRARASRALNPVTCTCTDSTTYRWGNPCPLHITVDP